MMELAYKIPLFDDWIIRSNSIINIVFALMPIVAFVAWVRGRVSEVCCVALACLPGFVLQCAAATYLVTSLVGGSWGFNAPALTSIFMHSNGYLLNWMPFAVFICSIGLYFSEQRSYNTINKYSIYIIISAFLITITLDLMTGIEEYLAVWFVVIVLLLGIVFMKFGFTSIDVFSGERSLGNLLLLTTVLFLSMLHMLQYEWRPFEYGIGPVLYISIFTVYIATGCIAYKRRSLSAKILLGPLLCSIAVNYIATFNRISLMTESYNSIGRGG